MALSDVTMVVDELGRGSLTVDGVEVLDRLSAVEVLVQPGQPSLLRVRQTPGTIAISGAAVVQVLEEGDVDEAAVIRGWLALLDPTELERAALASFDRLDPPGSTGEAWIRVLSEMVAPV